MKKILNILLLGGVFFFLKEIVYAKNTFELTTDPNGVTYMIYAGHTEYPFDFKPIKDVETKELVYCLEPGIALSSEEYEELSEWEYQKVKLTKEQKDYLTKVAYYGYGYKNHTSMNYYYAAQLLIWESVMPEGWDMYYTEYLGGPKKECFLEEREEILNLIGEDPLFPDFGNQKRTWNQVDKLKLTDLNHVLENYKITTQSSDKIIQNKDELEITGTEKAQIELEKIYEGAPLKFYYRERGQDLMKKGSLESFRTSLEVSPYELSLEVLKQDEKQNPIKGVTFALIAQKEIKNGDGITIYNANERVKSATTNEQGKIIFDHLWDGSYCLIETDAPDDYLVSKTPHCFEVNEQHQKEKITLENKRVTKKIKLLKEDEETKQPLKNVRFKIYDEQKKCIFDGYTNEEGIIELEDLPLGNYTISEVETMEGYILETKPYYFELKKDTTDPFVITITNKKIPEVPNTEENFPTLTMYYQRRKKEQE